jgi:DNA polymerase-4
MSRTILHLDMDAFFAAIEQLDHPEYRGKPVVVGADPQGGQGRGVVSTCSYEARVYGIHSAMPISHAYRKCPQAIYVPPRGRRYAEISKKIMSLLLSFSPDIEQISIDEAFLDISSTYKFHGTPKATAQAIKAKIRQEIQLTASVGVAPSKFVAKVASDLQKPDGLVIVEENRVKEFLSPLEISRLWGVGQKTLPLLQNLGIRTIGDLARYSLKELTERFGKSGLHFWRLANGIDEREIESEVRTKSISHETTFAQDTDDEQQLRTVLFSLCNALAREMRRKGFLGRTITLKIRLQDFSTFTRSRTLPRATNTSDEIFKCISVLYDNFDRQSSKVRLLGVAVSLLDSGTTQLNLFETTETPINKIDWVLDQVKEKFGDHAITRASLLGRNHDSDWIRE